MTAFPEWMDSAIAALEAQGSTAARKAWDAVRPAIARVHATPIDPFAEPAPVPVTRRTESEGPGGSGAQEKGEAGSRG